MKLRILLLIVVLILAGIVPSAAQDSSDCEPGFRLFDHELLIGDPVCIPENPERIAALDRFSFETMLALDIRPVAASSFALALTRDLPYLQDQVADVIDLGQPPNIELLLTTQPDLILSTSGYGEYEQLADIAPTVQIDFDSSGQWQNVAAVFGQAAGLEAETERLFADYQSRLAMFAEVTGEPGETAVSVVRVAADSISIYTIDQTTSFLGVILGDAGLAIPEAQAALAEDTTFVGTISVEQLPLVDADVLLIWTFATSDEVAANARSALEDLQANPLWSAVPVIQNEAAHIVGGYWIGSSFHAAHAIIDDLFTYIAGVDPAEVSPNPFKAVETASTGCEAGFRLVTHAAGETCIPENPQRVVVLDTGELDNALALSAPVVGAPVNDALQYQAYLSDQLDGISDIGSISEPNFEAILALEPDLILGSQQRYEAIYNQLSAIAPTVFTQSLRVPWQDNFRLHADALGKTEAAQQLLAEYEAHAADVQAVLADALDTTTVSIIRFRPGQVRLYLKSSYIGYILQDVGLQRPPSQDEDTFSAEISLEQVQDVDADYIFVTGYDLEDSERETFLNSPLWQTLGAVQAGRVVEINDDTWIAGLGVQAANLVLDDLETLLAPSADAADAAASECEPGFRLFDHEYLATAPVCIPENPERIIAIDEGVMADFVALGVEPIGVHDWATRDFSVYLDTETIVSVSTPEGPNLEAMLALNPDLIVGKIGDMAWYGDDFLENLQSIAPVVLSDTDNTLWEEEFLLHGAVVNREEEARELLGAYEARLAEFRELMGNEDFTIAIIRSRADAFNIYVGDYFIVDVVENAGLEFPEGFDELPSPNSISLEEIDMLDSDYLFVMVRNENEGEYFQQASEGPLWSFLPAVQQNQVYQVDWSTWVAGWNIVGAHLIIDDLFEYFTNTTSPTPNPFADLVTDAYIPVNPEATPEAAEEGG